MRAAWRARQSSWYTLDTGTPSRLAISEGLSWSW